VLGGEDSVERLAASLVPAGDDERCAATERHPEFGGSGVE